MRLHRKNRFGSSTDMAGFIVYKESGWNNPIVRKDAAFIEAVDKAAAKQIYEEEYGTEVFFATRRMELKPEYTNEILAEITKLDLS